jgi:hypothetical protein
LANSLHLFQDLIKDNNFAQDTHLKLCLVFKLQASQDETLKQNQDYVHFEILQTNSILSTTTTIMLQLLYKITPPKFIEKFES